MTHLPTLKNKFNILYAQPDPQTNQTHAKQPTTFADAKTGRSHLHLRQRHICWDFGGEKKKLSPSGDQRSVQIAGWFRLETRPLAPDMAALPSQGLSIFEVSVTRSRQRSPPIRHQTWNVCLLARGDENIREPSPGQSESSVSNVSFLYRGFFSLSRKALIFRFSDCFFRFSLG